jgi:hypothetical protein
MKDAAGRPKPQNPRSDAKPKGPFPHDLERATSDASFDAAEMKGRELPEKQSLEIARKGQADFEQSLEVA